MQRRNSFKTAKCIRKSYFSLTEILVALAIIALLTAIVVPMYYKKLEKAKVSTAKSQIKLLDQALMDYRLDVGKLPDDSIGLKILVENGSDNDKWDGPYLKGGRVPLDPWGNEYIYVIPGENSEYEIKSYGSDGQPGGTKTAKDLSSNQ